MTPTVAIYRGDLPDALADRFAQAGRLAWDIETSGLDWSRDRIGTCQLAGDDTSAVVQIDSLRRPDNLMRLLSIQSVQKVFHHAAFDLRFMAAAWGAKPQSIACTKVASKILNPQGANDAHSLKTLVRQHLGIQLDKDQQRSDWMVRELSPDQTRYALNDVLHLTSLLDRLLDKARQEGVEELIQASFAYLPARVLLDIRGSGDVFTY